MERTKGFQNAGDWIARFLESHLFPVPDRFVLSRLRKSYIPGHPARFFGSWTPRNNAATTTRIHIYSRYSGLKAQAYLEIDELVVETRNAGTSARKQQSRIRSTRGIVFHAGHHQNHFGGAALSVVMLQRFVMNVLKVCASGVRDSPPPGSKVMESLGMTVPFVTESCAG